jgi:hypothetical protein
METNREGFTAPNINDSDVNGDSGSEESNDNLGGYASPEAIDQFYLSDAGSGEPSVN